MRIFLALGLSLAAAAGFAAEGEEDGPDDAPDSNPENPAPERDFGLYLEARGSQLAGAADGFEAGVGFAVGFMYFPTEFVAVTQRYAQDARDYDENPAKGRLRTRRLELEVRRYVDVADSGAVFAGLSPGWTTSKLDLEDDTGEDQVASGGSVGLALGYEHEVAELYNVGGLVRFTYGKKQDEISGAAVDVGVFASFLTN